MCNNTDCVVRFRLIVELEIRLYSIIFLLLLFVFVLDTYFEHRGLEAARTPSSDALRRVYDVFIEVVYYLKRLREESPSAVSDCYKTLYVFVNMYDLEV